MMKKNILTIKLPEGAIPVMAASAVYLAVMMLLTGLQAMPWIVVVAFNLCFYLGKGSRRFILGFAVFIFFGLLYDVMRVFPNYSYHPVDIAPLYRLEKELFGISSHGLRVTLNEFFAANRTVAGDLVSGIFYINWIPVPLAFALYLYYTDRELFLHFSLTFLFVNLLGFCIYYLHPAAPPWYVARYGFAFHPGTHGETAGLAGFDRLIGFDLFKAIYTKNSNVFAALPSLHSAYPVVVLWYGIRARCGGFNLLFGIFMAGIWFAALYSGHHYLVDVILGVVCAITGILIYRNILEKQSFYRKFIAAYLRLISASGEPVAEA